MNRRTFTRQVAVAAAVAAALGFAPAAAAQTTLKFSHTDQPGGLRQKAAELFGQRVEQYTAGRYKVQVFPASQLANDPKAVEQLQRGGIDFTVTGTGTYATHIPTLNLTALPYLVETYEQGWKLYDESKWLQVASEPWMSGGTLFVAAKLAKAGIGEITRALWPLLAAAIAALLVITYVPEMTRVVWRLVA